MPFFRKSTAQFLCDNLLPMSHTLLTAIATYLILLLLRSVIYLPFNIQLWIGNRFGQLGRRISNKWRTTALLNLSTVFPGLSTTERQQLLTNHFRSVGIGLIEMGNAWWGSEKKLKGQVTVQGLEHLDRALKQGNGVILLSAHFTTLEIGGRLLSLFRPIHAMYREQDNKIFNKVRVKGRLSFLQSLVKKNDLRGMLKLLKQNQTIWYAMDQNSSDASAVFTNFFGTPCSTTAVTSKLAEKSGAIVIPFSNRRLEPENRYHLTIHPPLNNFPSKDRVADTQQIMDLFESEIRKAPEQYLWIHRRFKRQPEGAAPFYD